MTVTVHLVLPDSVDDPLRPSGGNVYDRRVADGLVARGHRVMEHLVDGTPGLGGALARVPDGATVLVDGLLASGAPDVVVPAARRVALGVLVHLPFGVEQPEARAAEREVLAAADAVVATSGWTRRWLAEQYGLADVRVATPGVDRAPVATPTPGGGALLVVGRVCAAKGYDVLADALARIDDLAWTCVWAGPPPGNRPFDTLPDRCNGQEVCRTDGYPGRSARTIALAGPLPHAAVAECYAAADLLVLPSRTESYGMVLAEALARGVPVLASDVGGVAETVGRTSRGRPGLLVPPGDPDALAHTLRRWLTDAGLRADLRAAALARRPALPGWDDTVSRLLEALPHDLGAAS